MLTGQSAVAEIAYLLAIELSIQVGLVSTLCLALTFFLLSELLQLLGLPTYLISHSALGEGCFMRSLGQVLRQQTRSANVHSLSHFVADCTDNPIVCYGAQTTLLCAAEHRQHFPREHPFWACQRLLHRSDLLGHFPSQVQSWWRGCGADGDPHDCHVLLRHVICHIQLQVQC